MKSLTLADVQEGKVQGPSEDVHSGAPSARQAPSPAVRAACVRAQSGSKTTQACLAFLGIVSMSFGFSWASIYLTPQYSHIRHSYHRQRWDGVDITRTTRYVCPIFNDADTKSPAGTTEPQERSS
eukprot:TRINITY_DN1244_c0_g1_i2.p1 TRINITY_DN1244_c0_g1~~TRINITY_DN1244_c0_g1_i2.p1  ORF type:complete len:125 (+),score=18.66 TRINITY_DN1244_c0_g1_i2:111-485(+)